MGASQANMGCGLWAGQTMLGLLQRVSVFRKGQRCNLSQCQRCRILLIWYLFLCVLFLKHGSHTV